MSAWRTALFVATLLAAYAAVGSIQIAVERELLQDDIRHAAR